MPDGAPITQSEALLARLEAVPNSLWYVRARVIMGSATLFDAFNALSIAFVLPILRLQWSISPQLIGLMISSSYVGQLLGALLFSALAERFGRVKSAAAATAIFAAMSLACAFAPNYWMLFTLRFIQGIGVGGEMPVAAVYVSEISKARGRGRFFMLYEMIFPIGLMITGQVGAVLVPYYGWQTMFLVGGIPGLLIAALLLRLPESPRWLISKGRFAEADRVIAQIEAAAGQIAVAPAPVLTAPAIAAPAGKPRNRWLELLSPAFRARTLVVWALWATAYLMANSLNNWAPTLYTTVYHLPIGDALRAASMNNVAQVALLLVCALLVDRSGRRYWMMGAFGGGAILMAILALGGTEDVRPVILLSTFGYGLVGSINAVLYLYTPEIYPTRMRAIGTGVATAWLRAASAIGPAMVGFMVATSGVDSVFFLFAVVCVLGLIASLWMIETRNLRLEDIAK